MTALQLIFLRRKRNAIRLRLTVNFDYYIRVMQFEANRWTNCVMPIRVT